ncbi:MAG: hypothetical protein CMJ89_10225 [Planctomycetes bacterium]|nr:hypothetical protein [Planctomycetota bacterium]
MRAFTLAALPFLISLNGCGGPDGPTEEHNSRGRGVLLVTIDTTRADRIGAYGYGGGGTDTIDRLAEEGILFEQALSTAPITLPAHASLLTGVYPSAHGLHDNGIFKLSEEGTPIAEVLRRHGFRTGAFVGSFILDRRYGLDQGFEVYDGPRQRMDTTVSERPAGRVVDRAIQWIDTLDLGDDYFGWIHFYDPHLPWTPPDLYRLRFDHPYDAEIAYCDEELGRLLAHLEKRGLMDELTVIVTADHGEDMDDHGEANHGVFLYQSTMHVPLIVSGSLVQKAAGTRVSRPVSLVSLPATLLRLLGIAADEMPDMVRLPLLDGDGATMEPATTAPLYLETYLPYYSHRWHPYLGLVSGKHKFIRGKGVELYDLVTDPQESNNLAAVRPEVVKGLERELQALLAEYSDLAWVVDRALEEGDRQALEALGYTGGAAGGDPFNRSLPDPHERVAGQKELNRARSLMIQANLMATPSTPGSQDPAKLERGRELLLQAQAILEDLTRDHAADPLLRLSLGEVKFGLGDHAGALPYFEQALAEQPDSVSTLFSLGVCYVQTGKTERALKTVRKAQSLDPKFSQAYMFLAWHHRENGNYGKAAWWMQALLDELEPGDPSLRQVEHDLALLERLMKQHQQAPTPPD